MCDLCWVHRKWIVTEQPWERWQLICYMCERIANDLRWSIEMLSIFDGPNTRGQFFLSAAACEISFQEISYWCDFHSVSNLFLVCCKFIVTSQRYIWPTPGSISTYQLCMNKESLTSDISSFGCLRIVCLFEGNCGTKQASQAGMKLSSCSKLEWGVLPWAT